MSYVACAVAGLLALLAVLPASAATPKRPVTHVEVGTPADAIPKAVKAVCKSKVLRIKTDNWIELRRRQRCFT
jgi:hypothetical protein